MIKKSSIISLIVVLKVKNYNIDVDNKELVLVIVNYQQYDIIKKNNTFEEIKQLILKFYKKDS